MDKISNNPQINLFQILPKQLITVNTIETLKSSYKTSSSIINTPINASNFYAKNYQITRHNPNITTHKVNLPSISIFDDMQMKSSNNDNQIKIMDTDNELQQQQQNINEKSKKFSETIKCCNSLNSMKIPVKPTATNTINASQQRTKVMIRVCNSSLPETTVDTTDYDTNSTLSYLVIDNWKKQLTVYDPLNRKSTFNTLSKIFSFDDIFGTDTNQYEICNLALSDALYSVMDGIDGCIVSYGSRLNDKENTIIGSDKYIKTFGLIPLAICWLFKLIDEMKDKYTMSICAFEIADGSRETVNDLISAFNYNETYEYKNTNNSDLNRNPFCVSELNALTIESAMNCLDFVINNRSDNEFSHFIFSINIYKHDKHSNETVTRSRLSFLNFDNLQKTKDILSNCTNLNDTQIYNGSHSLSLTQLSEVLTSAINGQQVLPYSQSKLTSVIKDFMYTKQTRILVLSHISPTIQNYNETLQIIQFTSKLYRNIKKQSNKVKNKVSNSLASSVDTLQANNMQIISTKPININNAGNKFRKRHTDTGTSEYSCSTNSSSTTTATKPKQFLLKQNNNKKLINTNNEIWIDGPKQQSTKQDEIWIDGPNADQIDPRLIQVKKDDEDYETCSDNDVCTVICKIPPPISLIEPNLQLDKNFNSFQNIKQTYFDTIKLDKICKYDSYDSLECLDHVLLKQLDQQCRDINNNSSSNKGKHFNPDSRPISLLSINSNIDSVNNNQNRDTDTLVTTATSMSQISEGSQSKTSSCTELSAINDVKDEIVRNESEQKLINDHIAAAINELQTNYSTLPNPRSSQATTTTSTTTTNEQDLKTCKQKLDDLKTSYDKMIFKQSYKEMESLHKTLESMLGLKQQSNFSTTNDDTEKRLSRILSPVRLIPKPDELKSRLSSDSSDQYAEPFDNLSNNPQNGNLMENLVTLPSSSATSSSHSTSISSSSSSSSTNNTTSESQKSEGASSPSVLSTPKTQRKSIDIVKNTPVSFNQKIHASFKLFRNNKENKQPKPQITTAPAIAVETPIIPMTTNSNKQKDSIFNRLFNRSKSKDNKTNNLITPTPTLLNALPQPTLYCNQYMQQNDDVHKGRNPLSLSPYILSSSIAATANSNDLCNIFYNAHHHSSNTNTLNSNDKTNRCSISDTGSVLSCELLNSNQGHHIDYTTFSSIIKSNSKNANSANSNSHHTIKTNNSSLNCATSSSGYESMHNRDSNDSDNASTSSTTPNKQQQQQTSPQLNKTYKINVETLANNNSLVPSYTVSNQNAVTSIEKRLNSKKDELRKVHIMELKQKQKSLLNELSMTKQRLLVDNSQWSSNLHVQDCMSSEDEGYVEALEKETEILEKRVHAAKSRIMKVTCFDVNRI